MRALWAQHAGEPPSDRLSSGAVVEFTEALTLVEEQFAYERLRLERDADAEDVQQWDEAQAQVRFATRYADQVYREEQEAARLRTIDRLRADSLAAEAALDDEASRWLGLLATALESGDYSRLAI